MYSLQHHINEKRNRVLTERFASGGGDKAVTLIIQYLEKRLGKLVKMPGVEHFRNSHGEGYGLRYFTSKGKSFRLNWRSESGKGDDIVSVDVWDGTSHDPNAEIVTKGISLAKILPSLADLIVRPEMGTIAVLAESGAVQGNILQEARGPNVEDVYEELLDLFNTSPTFSAHSINSQFRTTGMALWRKILKVHGDLFEVETRGTKQIFNLKKGAKTSKFNKAEILASMVEVKVGEGGSGEDYTSPEIKRLEAEAKKANAIPYEEQLSDLNNLVKAVAKGASNALFVGGAGGIGKTHSVEKALAQIGLKDGAGYFKNTTSASASGMYRTLYDYRNDIILFDDCDAVFKDQESRNVLKAATDTRKERKLGWTKSGSWLYKGNPEDLEAQGDMDADSEDPFSDKDDTDKLYPKYFTFRGKIIFISNLQLDQLDPDGALRTRGFVISINPTNEEVLSFMEKIIGDIKIEDGLSLDKAERLKVLNVLKGGHNADDVNLRKLVRGINMAAAGVDGWETLVARYA